MLHHMRIIGIIFLLALLVATFRLRVENQALKHSLEAVSDTLGSQRIQQQWLEESTLRLMQGWIEPYLQKKEGVIELHRITAISDGGFFLLQFELRQDRSIEAVFKKVMPEQPFPKDFSKIKFTHDSAVITLNLIDFELFKDKINQIEFSNATISNHLMCCFGGGTLKWAAILADGNNRNFSTFCRQSAQFAEACEFMLKKVSDPDLTKMLQGNAKNSF